MKEIFDSYLSVLKNYANFNGRADRPTFWYFVLVNLSISIALSILHLNGASMLYSLVMLIPGLAVGARRLHDIGKSGWMQLVSLIPIVGIIWLIILFAQEGQKEDNQYGKALKATTQEKEGEGEEK